MQHYMDKNGILLPSYSSFLSIYISNIYQKGCGQIQRTREVIDILEI